MLMDFNPDDENVDVKDDNDILLYCFQTSVGLSDFYLLVFPSTSKLATHAKLAFSH